MPNCEKCGAPLAAYAVKCVYCGGTASPDLRGTMAFSKSHDASSRNCPSCSISMSRIRLATKPPVVIDRCDTCFGMFFDPKELDKVVAAATSDIFGVNGAYLLQVNQDSVRAAKPRGMLNCPDCSTTMGKQRLGQSTTASIDVCPSHGAWLDGGELRYLLEWTKSGGEALFRRRDLYIAARRHELRKHKGSKLGVAILLGCFLLYRLVTFVDASSKRKVVLQWFPVYNSSQAWSPTASAAAAPPKTRYEFRSNREPTVVRAFYDRYAREGLFTIEGDGPTDYTLVTDKARLRVIGGKPYKKRHWKYVLLLGLDPAP